MALTTATKEQVRAYREADALNQSTLKKLLDGLRGIKAGEAPPSPAMALGSAVDCILLGEEGQFERDHACVDGTGLSPTERKIVEDILAMSPQWADFRENAERAIADSNWQPNWKMETRIDKIAGKGGDYFMEMRGARGKAVLSPEQWAAAHAVARSLLESPRTRAYFDREAIRGDEARTVHHQLPVRFRHAGLDCKALIDILVVHRDPETGAAVRAEPIDLKTVSGHVLDFPMSVRKYRYDLQAAWYGLAAQAWLDQQGMADVPVDNFGFVVESTAAPGTPLVFRCSDSLMRQGMWGEPEVRLSGTVLRQRRKGVNHLVADWNWYAENGWETERIIAEREGPIPIDWDGIAEA